MMNMSVRARFFRYYATLLVAAMVMALILAFVSEPRGGRVKNGLFFGGWGHSAEKEHIKAAVRAYNAAAAGIYVSAGTALGELNIIPAVELEKRKLYKDVLEISRDGLVLVFDKDEETVEQIQFVNRDKAYAITHEIVAIMFQDLATRKRLSKVKASQIRCRYHFKRVKEAWRVEKVEVFPDTELIGPPPERARL